MAAVSKANSKTSFEVKSAALDLVSLVLRTADAQELGRELEQAPQLFEHEPVALDLSLLGGQNTEIDFEVLIELLRRHRMAPLAVVGGSPLQTSAALAAALYELPQPTAGAENELPVPPEIVLTEVIREVNVAAATMLVDKPLRSGQQIYARGGDLVLLAVVSFGAEVIADGNIHVYAPLRGRAIAGAAGNGQARIFTTCMEPQLVAIAGIYRTTETALPADVLGKPAQVRLEGERLVVEALRL